MTATPELPVPAEAMATLDAIAPGRNRGLRNDVRAVAAPVVAAELRRIADEHWNRNLIAPADLRHWLRARADELDPPTSKD